MKLVKAGKNTDDKRRCNARKTTTTDDLIATVATAVEDDRRVRVKALAKAFNVASGTIFNIIHNDLGLVKKSARWVPKLLSPNQMEKRVETSAAFVQLVQEKGRGILSRIVTMDKSAVSMHTPETKRQSMQWLKKGVPGPVKAKVTATRAKQMVLAFFDDQGMVYTNYVPRGVSVNAAYIVDALRTFLKALQKKRPDIVAGERFLQWDNTLVHTAEVVQTFLVKNSIQLIPHPPTLLTLLQRTFSCSHAKEGALGQDFDFHGVQNHVERGHQNHHERRLRRGLHEVVRAMRKMRLNRRKLCREVLENKYSPNYNAFCFICVLQFDFERTP